jgi:hypothetical protein
MEEGCSSHGEDHKGVHNFRGKIRIGKTLRMSRCKWG